MNFIIIDLEFNNMQKIENFIPDKALVPAVNYECPNEIIQIGAVKLDKYFNVLDTFETYIKPKVYKVINPAITEMTGITSEHLEEGLHFKDALELMEAFADEDSIFCSWAKDDPIELIRNANYHNLNRLHWLAKYIDVQEYCTKVLAEKRSLGLKRAMEKLNVVYEEENLHNALNDCMYTVEVLKRVFNFRALQSYIIYDIVDIPFLLLRTAKDNSGRKCTIAI